MSVPSQARIVVIGGGAVGCSIAYHLAQLGQRDVLVLEKSGLTHGSTWHAAGLVGQLRSKRNLTRLMQYSAQLYGRLEAETGQATEWKPVGSLRLASSPERWSELKRMATTARSFDFELHTLSPKESQEKFPLITPDGIVGAVFVPTDGSVEPSSLTMAYAKGARAGGVRIVENVLVTGFEATGRRITRVLTDQGAIACEIVVNAAGIWARDVAHMAGVKVPAGAVEHQYLITEKSEAIPKGLPTLRDPDRIFYLKPEPGALAIGGWEKGTPTFGASGVPFNFGRELLQPNQERLEQFVLPAAERLPILNELGIRTVINGPIPISPDGEPIMGLAPERDNFYVACGFTSGIAASGGAGKAMAEWIVEGEPGLDLWAFDVRRFGSHHMSARYLAERSVDSYWRYYQIHYPIEELHTARGGRRSPLYPLLQAKNAVFGSRFGWERPNWFAPAGSEAVDRPSFEGRPNWFAAVGNECRAARERAVLIDQSSFSKYEIGGPGALAALQRLAANDLDKPRGTLTYTQLCNERGGIEADLTFARLDEDRFYMVTGSAFGVRDMGWIRKHLPADGSVTVQELTSARATINLAGPRARDILQKVADGDVSNDAFPYMNARNLCIGYAPVLALRVTYVGELGYELHLPTEYAAHVYELLWAAGGAFGIVDAGYRAIDSLRLEKRYLYWGADITPDYTPYEAGLGFAVSLKKNADFIGRAALEKAHAMGPRRRLITLLVDAEIQLYGGEAIRRNGKVLGVTSSAGWGHTIGKAIAFGYVPTEESGHPDYEIEAFTRRHPARRIAGAAVDPERRKILI
ncbi:FAD-dependent oxidoreductase [Reyranella sp.]|uniref:FAD-dependent oxidoreductase n=1 Tax=Reyranella sp. TaxID=1929291 RepID=UPI0037838777